MLGRKTKIIAALGAALIAVCLLLTGMTACGEQEPVTITVWNYYNGAQSNAFLKLVNEFNNTVGTEKGVIVEQKSQSAINTLADELLNSVQHKSKAQPLPNLAAVYSETAYLLEKEDALAALDGYFTDDELAAYVPAFIEEGRLVEDGPLYLMPISKSTEVAAFNKTDWAPFEAATGNKIADIQTIEKLVEVAAAYYEWSGGKALYGRDSLENYVYASAAQLGHELFRVDAAGNVTIDIDRATFRTMWDNYYVPMVNGYFYGEKNIDYDKSTYSSDLVVREEILALTCSTSAMTYFPTEIESNGVKRKIETVVTKPLMFAGHSERYVQQGAGYCVLKTTQKEEDASVLFLKWFTEKTQNLTFAVTSSYCPVKTESLATAAIDSAFGTADTPKAKNILQSLLVSSEILASGHTYACKPFDGAKDVRSYLGDALENVTIADCGKIATAMENGATREEAIQELDTDFDAWFDDMAAHVQDMLKK